MLPQAILFRIFSFLSLPERWPLSIVCKQWYSIIHDPYLYQHVEFTRVEYNALVYSLEKLVKIAPRIKSITIDRCYSYFIQNMMVEYPPTFFCYITALPPSRRKREYTKQGFRLHQQFSDAMSSLLRMNRKYLVSITIQYCQLDLPMTDLYCAIAHYGQSLECLYYIDNHDQGISSAGLLESVVYGCPNMCHFKGFHAGMNDTVLFSIARHWHKLESLSLCSTTEQITNEAFWHLLTHLSLSSLELHDCDFISNETLASPMCVSDLGCLKMTKYMTTPLSKPGFQSLLRLFPNLKRLEYETNFYAFDNLFKNMTLDMFEAEYGAVRQWFKQHKIDYIGKWNTPPTLEQCMIHKFNNATY